MRETEMKDYNAKIHNDEAIAKAEQIINDFLNVRGRIIYVINPDGSTFTLEKGCMLLTVDHSHMQMLEREV
jgi:hypothetical protein